MASVSAQLISDLRRKLELGTAAETSTFHGSSTTRPFERETTEWAL